MVKGLVKHLLYLSVRCCSKQDSYFPLAMIMLPELVLVLVVKTSLAHSKHLVYFVHLGC